MAEYPCPCCGYLMFNEEPGSYDICEVCGWEDDLSQLRFATVAGMFANPEYGGNADKTGWKLLGFNDQFSWSSPFGWYDRNA